MHFPQTSKGIEGCKGLGIVDVVTSFPVKYQLDLVVCARLETVNNQLKRDL